MTVLNKECGCAVARLCITKALNEIISIFRIVWLVANLFCYLTVSGQTTKASPGKMDTRYYGGPEDTAS